MIEKHDFVFLSNIAWDFSWQRHQQLATRFSQKNRVLFVEPPVSPLLLFYNAGFLIEFWKRRRRGLKEVRENLFVFAPPLIFPGGGSFFSLTALNQKMLAAAVRKTIFRLGFFHPLVLNFSPFFNATSFDLGQSLTVYDCVDEWVAEGKGKKKRLVEMLERKVLSKSDLVLTTSRYLYRAKKAYSDRIFFVPNGSDFRRYQLARQENERSLLDIDPHPFPRIGYIGTFNRCLDGELLYFLATKRPQWSFIFIGMVNTNPGRLKRLPNVHFLGHKSISELPHYLRKLSLGIIPYRITKETKAIHPVKAYDYLSSGLPVVSTPLPECDYFKNHIEVARTPKSFLICIEKSLHDDNPELRKRRITFARDNSWDERAEAISRILKEFV